MRKLTAALFMAAAACAPAGPPTPAGPVSEIAGRVAGPAQRCISFDSSNSLRLTDSHRIVYGSGSTIWLNTAVCDGSSRNDIIVTYPLGSQHCRGDIVRTVDRLSQIPGPGCVLGDFVPYRRP
jgi:hypothetical protein